MCNRHIPVEQTTLFYPVFQEKKCHRFNICNYFVRYHLISLFLRKHTWWSLLQIRYIHPTTFGFVCWNCIPCKSRNISYSVQYAVNHDVFSTKVQQSHRTTVKQYEQ